MDHIDSFLSEILDKKQLTGMNDDVRADVIEEMRTSLLDQINRALVDALPDDKLDQFQQLAEDPNATDEAVQAFIQESGINVEEVTASTMLRFRDLYLQGVNTGEPTQG